MKIISLFILILFAFHSFGQISRYSKPPQVYVPSTDMGLSNVTRALEQANARAESNYNQIEPLVSVNEEILRDRLKNGCDIKLLEFYGAYMEKLKKQNYSLGSPQDVASLKSELSRLRSTLIAFDCSKPTPQLKNEVSVSQNNANTSNYQSINGKGVTTDSFTSVWSDAQIFKATKIGELGKGIEVNVIGLYSSGVYEVYQVILDNGKSGYIGKSYILLK